MQNITFTGNLTRDAEIKDLGGKEYLDIQVAVNQYNGPNKDKTANFYSVRSPRAGMAKSLRKGDQVIVAGELSIRVSEPNEKYPTPKTFLDVFASAVDFGKSAGGGGDTSFPAGDDDVPANL